MKWQQVFRGTLVWFHVLFLFYAFSLVSGKVFSERRVLLELKNSVSDPSGILSSWDEDGSNSSHHCSWYGVSCDSKSRVTSVNVTGGDFVVERGNSQAFSRSKFSQFAFHGFGIRRTCSHRNGKLEGKLSPLIGKLTELRALSLPFNSLSGEIPIEIWGLENLEVLDLEGNSFTGKLPNRFKGLRKLKVLNIGFNKIVGEIPFSLSKCVSLRVLNLAGNEVNGSIPVFFGSFPELWGLYLSLNQLTGSVPDEFGYNCQNLEHLDLSGNFLIGGIPRSFGKCRRLRTLLLFSNKLDDVIPHELGQLRKLEVLDVSRNSLNGPIPAELGNCVELSVLVLSNIFDSLSIRRSQRDENNHFQGSIPMEIMILPKLKIIWAPRASLEGKFPRNWGGCDSLEMVNLAENLFSGETTGVFGGCKNLHFLNLSSNRLTGELDGKLPVPCMTRF
ncbi:hypothetical protein L1049_006134 [Liquidambar formosana]|uniref:Leucine-rich repeat-containing N-terminal plant-type domain-containing protein n=1 Tax=Liquidambar formosana TaxID=63359 RepID=A0AAP0RFG0_LIQFO